MAWGFIFWCGAGWVTYTYAGYPVAIWLASRLGRHHRERFDVGAQPAVTVVMAVRNGEAMVRTKLDNLLQLAYPKDKLQIIVVSDGSTDGTAAAVASYAESGVELVELTSSSGKPTALNRGVERARGDVVVFCDVRQRLDVNAVAELVRHFNDPTVGAVSGELEIAGAGGPGAYWKYEKLIRAAEGRFDSVPGATGALFAIRTRLFRPLPGACLLDDVFTPMQIVLSGYRVLFEPAAKAYDQEAELDDEFQRKARTLAGNFQLVELLPEVINPFKNRIFWQFSSHKLARLACPYALAAMLVSNGVLALGPARVLYLPLLLAQASAYGAAGIGALGGSRAGRLARLAHTFVVLNAAAVEGLRRYVKRDFTWTASKSK